MYIIIHNRFIDILGFNVVSYVSNRVFQYASQLSSRIRLKSTECTRSPSNSILDCHLHHIDCELTMLVSMSHQTASMGWDKEQLNNSSSEVLMRGYHSCPGIFAVVDV